jgi:hypothetical protein
MYNCVIAQLQNVRSFPKADKILLANACGYQVVVGLDNKEGEIVALFIDDGRLSDEYLCANNLVGYMDASGVRQGGFFSSNGRVRTQRFRGEKSEAYVASLESFKFTGYDISSFKIGDQFNELNGIPICMKYFTSATKGASQGTNKEKSSKSINKQLRLMFPEHKDTNQIRFARDEDLVGLVTITAKLHGTSQRSAFILYPTEGEIKNPFKKLWNIFCDEVLHGPKSIFNFWCNAEKVESFRCRPKVDYSWEHIYGTRRVIKGRVDFNPTADYRNQCAAKVAAAIKKNEVWYYEIVGYEDTGASIMQTVSTADMPKDFRKRFGDIFTYKYGCLPGTCDVYVYRITVQGPDSEVYELPWNVVKARCVEAGVKHVPEVYCQIIRDNGFDVSYLKEAIEKFTEEVDIAEPLDLSHIREGICVRIENPDTGKSTIWKNKTFAFKVLEGIAKNSESYVDTEEVEGDTNG